MAARAGRYPPEYRERLVELARAGRSPGSLAREFEPSEQTIRNWVRRTELDEEERNDGLTTEGRGVDLPRFSGQVKVVVPLRRDQEENPPLRVRSRRHRALGQAGGLGSLTASFGVHGGRQHLRARP